MKKYLALGILMIVFSCTNADKKSATSMTDSTLKSEEAIGKANVELSDSKVQNIYDGYISLKNALVQTDLAGAQKAAAGLKASLASYKGCENTAVIADKIAAAGDIATQRKEFIPLSADVIALFKHADLKKGSIYIQHCPMANNGEGGDWLSSEEKIQNPYYGEEMMECGEVTEAIKTTK